jgi:hypothetical protein
MTEEHPGYVVDRAPSDVASQLERAAYLGRRLFEIATEIRERGWNDLRYEQIISAFDAIKDVNARLESFGAISFTDLMEMRLMPVLDIETNEIRPAVYGPLQDP